MRYSINRSFEIELDGGALGPLEATIVYYAQDGDVQDVILHSPADQDFEAEKSFDMFPAATQDIITEAVSSHRAEIAECQREFEREYQTERNYFERECA